MPRRSLDEREDERTHPRGRGLPAWGWVLIGVVGLMILMALALVGVVLWVRWVGWD